MSALRTRSGKQFDVFRPRVEDLDIHDIASGLANKCRWYGQCPFYSVAEHSFLMSEYARHHGFGRIVAQWCLLHDAAEFILPDVASPIKGNMGWMEVRHGNAAYFQWFEAVEKKILEVVAVKFGLPVEIPPEVKVLDQRIRNNESTVFFGWIENDLTPLEIALEQIKCLSPNKAIDLFMAQYVELFVR